MTTLRYTGSKALRLLDEAEDVVLSIMDRMRATRAAHSLTWDVHPDYLRLKRILAKAERRSARRLRNILTPPK
jgi:hypothetical protein